jgi:hypothetical protein
MILPMPFTKKTKVLKSFGDASTALANYLRDGEKLDVDDRAFIENNILIVQLAYTTWKHIHQKKQRKESDSALPSKSST